MEVQERLRFDELGLSAETLQAVQEMGFETASPIQSQAIPLVMSGRDVIGQAQTGTGKTAAFGIPMIEATEPFSKSVEGLILCPTRELAMQVSEEMRKLSKFKKGIFITTVYGGDSIERQIKSLKSGANIVVGTPGRVIDMIERRALKLEKVKIAVLDEADEMLDMGFREDIESILQETPNEKQTVLFSATMSKQIMALTKNYQNDPFLIKVVKNEVTNDNIEQLYYDVKGRAKMEVMTRLIDFYGLNQILVFCNQKKRVDEVVEDLQIRGYSAEGLHGDLRQQQRSNVMAKFKQGTTTILVATDVAARGIDVDNLSAVVNFDIPLDEEYYVHRIGRTGRAGNKGKAFTFVVGAERNRLRDIMSYTKVKIDKGVIPSFSDVVGVKKGMFIEKIKAEITEGGLESFDDVLANLQHGGFSTEQIVSALVKMSMGVSKSEFGDENLEGNSDRGDRYGDRGGRRDERGGGRFGDRDRGGDRGGRRDDRGGSSSRFGDRDSRGGDSRGGDRGGSSRFGDRDRGGDRGGSRFGDRDRAPRAGGDRPRFERESGREFSKGAEAGMVRLAINTGRDDRISPSNIVGAIAGECQIPGSSIGHIEIQDRVTYVDIPKDMANQVKKGLENSSIKGRKVSVEITK
jgi:ATP-dependent RNA helicase DeaD